MSSSLVVVDVVDEEGDSIHKFRYAAGSIKYRAVMDDIREKIGFPGFLQMYSAEHKTHLDLLATDTTDLHGGDYVYRIAPAGPPSQPKNQQTEDFRTAASRENGMKFQAYKKSSWANENASSDVSGFVAPPSAVSNHFSSSNYLNGGATSSFSQGSFSSTNNRTWSAPISLLPTIAPPPPYQPKTLPPSAISHHPAVVSIDPDRRGTYQKKAKYPFVNTVGGNNGIVPSSKKLKNSSIADVEIVKKQEWIVDVVIFDEQKVQLPIPYPSRSGNKKQR